MASTKTRKDQPVRKHQAIGYCRISLDDERDGKGVGRQTKDVTKYAEEKGLYLLDVIVDNDASASQYQRRQRPGWLQMIELIEAGEVDTIIGYDPDRVVRQNTELEQLIKLAESGLHIYTRSGLMPDLNDGSGRLMARILVSFAASESDNLSRRQKRKLQEVAEDGDPHWSARPFGLCKPTDDDETKAQAKREASLIREWAKRLLAGESMRALALDANKRGFTTTLGSDLTGNAIKRILKSPRTAGLREYNLTILGPGNWDAILDMETWDMVKDKLDANARARAPRTRGRTSLTSHITRCDNCGMVMNRFPGQLRCQSAKVINGERCKNSISVTQLDRLLGKLIVAQAKNLAARPSVEVDSGQEELRLRLSGLEARRDSLIEEGFALSAPAEVETNKRQTVRVIELINEVQSRIVDIAAEELIDEVAGDPETLETRWPDLDGERQNMILRKMATSVRIAQPQPDQPHNYFDGDRLLIEWVG